LVLADIALARRLEASEAAAGVSFVEARGRISPEVGASWVEIGGARAMFDGPDSPLTQTFCPGIFSEATTADLERLEGFFRERRTPVNHEVSPLAGISLAQLLVRRGYRPLEFTNVLFKAIGADTEVARPDSAMQVRVMEPGEEDLWSQISARGWAEHPEWTEFLQSLGRVTASSDGALPFFACLDEEPVATGLLRCHDGVALFGGASTIPKARRRGAQAALLTARMNCAIRQGCELAMICAEPGSSSQCNAQRQGFRIAYTRTKWQLSCQED
jgi:hypothetical protein